MRLRASTRIVLAALIFVAPVAFLLREHLAGSRAALATTEREIVALRAQRELAVAVCALNRRHLEHFYDLDDPRGEDRRIDAAFARLTRLEAEHGAILGWSAAAPRAHRVAPTSIGEISLAWRALRDDAGLPEGLQRVAYSGLLASLEALISHTSDAAGLTLDAELDTYYMLHAASEALPSLSSPLMTAALQFGETLSPEARAVQTGFLVRLIRTRAVATVDHDVRTSLGADAANHGAAPQTAPRMRSTMRRFHAALDPFLDQLDRLGRGDALPDDDLPDIMRRGSVDSLHATEALWVAALDTADVMLDARVRDLSAARLRSVLVAAVSLLVASLTAAATLAQFMREIGRLARATTRVAEGDLAVSLPATGRDELDAVARNFNRMVDAVRARDAALSAHSDALEAQVAQETAAIRQMLDAMHEGLLMCALDGSLLDERSRRVEEMFGRPADGAALWDYLAGDDAALRAALRVGFEAIAEDALPFALNAEQMPQRIARGDRTVAMEYRQVFVGDDFSRVLVIARDITDELARQNAAERQRELPAVTGHAVRNRRGFERFLAECASLLDDVGGGDELAARRRALHTLKGNAATYGLRGLAARCHRLEDQVALDPSALTPAAVDALRATWERGVAPVRDLLGEMRGDQLQLDAVEHSEFVVAMVAHGVDESLVERARGWRHETLEQTLEPFVGHVEWVASRLGKGVRVTVSAAGVRVTDESLRPFLASLVHVFRNAVVHGIESPAEREAAGKDPDGALRVEAWRDAAALHLTVSDDGAGIDWEALRARALALGLPAADRADLERALFADSVTTLKHTSDLAGRGVGMSALRACCVSLGGTISVRSERGRGTTLAFDLPARASPPRDSRRPAPPELAGAHGGHLAAR